MMTRARLSDLFKALQQVDIERSLYNWNTSGVTQSTCIAEREERIDCSQQHNGKTQQTHTKRKRVQRQHSGKGKETDASQRMVNRSLERRQRVLSIVCLFVSHPIPSHPIPSTRAHLPTARHTAALHDAQQHVASACTTRWDAHSVILQQRRSRRGASGAR